MLKIGQKIYVAQSTFFSEEKELKTYVITDVNSVSFYAKPEEINIKPLRFDKRTLKHKANFSILTAYLDESHFYQIQSLEKEKNDLLQYIKANLSDLSVDQLRAIHRSMITEEVN